MRKAGIGGTTPRDMSMLVPHLLLLILFYLAMVTFSFYQEIFWLVTWEYLYFNPIKLQK